MESIKDLFSVLYETPILVGEGAFGKVYRLKEKASGQFYALKVLESEAIWDKERMAMHLADHPLFPRMIASGKASDGFYILMEYIWGENLRSFIERRGPLSQPDAMRIALTVADGLAFLQQQDKGLVYRDLKAENLMISPEGEVRVLDLGCVCGLLDTGKSIAGTPEYSAPEQFDTPEGVGFYSDVYAFGKLFFYLLTGELPEQGDLLRSYDSALSSQLELLLYQCMREDGNTRLPDLYCVLERLIGIGSETRLKYGIMERKARKQLAKELSGKAEEIVFEKNLRGK